MRVSLGQWLYLQSKGIALLALLVNFGLGFIAFAMDAYWAEWFSDIGVNFNYARMVIAFVWAILWTTD